MGKGELGKTEIDDMCNILGCCAAMACAGVVTTSVLVMGTGAAVATRGGATMQRVEQGLMAGACELLCCLVMPTMSDEFDSWRSSKKAC